MTAPVSATLPKPSASGRLAAASDPKTASRMMKTIGKPVRSAVSRSFLVRSCMPAHSACWPTRCTSTPSRGSLLGSSSSRRSVAASAASSRLPETFSGTTTIGRPPAPASARSRSRLASATWSTSSAARSTRASSRRTAASSPSLRTASTTASDSRSAWSKSSIAWSPLPEPEPGTTNPPLVRWSVCLSVNGSAANSSPSQVSSTSVRRRATAPSSRSIAFCMGPYIFYAHAPRRVRWLTRSGAEQEPRRGNARLERGVAVPLGVGEQLQLEAVAQREQHRHDGLGVAAQLDDALALLLAQRLGDVGALTPPEGGQLGADLVVRSRGAEHLVDQRLGARVLFHKLAHLAHEDLDDLVHRVGVVQRRRQALDAQVGVVAHDFDEQALLGAEVVVQQPARDAGLGGHVVEGRAGRAAAAHARPHRGHDAL